MLQHGLLLLFSAALRGWCGVVWWMTTRQREESEGEDRDFVTQTSRNVSQDGSRNTENMKVQYESTVYSIQYTVYFDPMRSLHWYPSHIS